MKFLIWLILKVLPWEIVSEINELSLDELDKRGCIIWDDKPEPKEHV